MEEEKFGSADHHQSMQYCSTGVMSPEIVEIGEDSSSIGNGRDGVARDIYVAVGKDDLDVLKWTLDHAVSPGARIFLVHVFPPITYINTPVGRLARSQLSEDQVRVYINEENNKRRNLLQKYIRMCTNAKVTVETMLIENHATAKAILDLISVLNITCLIMGTMHSPCSRRLRKKLSKGEFVKKNAPDYCEVTVVHDGKKVSDSQQASEAEPALSSSPTSRPKRLRHFRRNLLGRACFSACRSRNY